MGVDEIAMSNVSLSFETVKGTFKALDQISFSLKRGDNLSLIGESGSGDSDITVSYTHLTLPTNREV